MKTRGSKMEDGGWPARSVLECGDKRSATPLSDARDTEKLRRCCALPKQSKTWRNLVALLLFLGVALTAHAQSYSIDWHTIDGGGGTSTGGPMIGGNYSISGTIGQPDAGGPMTSGQYSVTGGFWALPTAVQTTNAPTLTIAPAAPGQATLSWTPATPRFVLQETWGLSPANWTNSPSAAANPIVVPATVPAKFYRLHRP
jgi:hypothetical protein